MEQIAGFYFCHCPDMQLAKEHIENTYIRSFGDVWINAERHIVWTDEINAFLFVLDSIGFETKNKIYYLRDCHELTLEQWKKISLALAKPRTDVFPVFFIHNALDKGKLKLPQVIQKQKCFEFAQKKGWIFESVGITEKNFVQTIKNEAKLKYDLNLSSDVLNILKEILSPDYNSINNILAQLSLFAGQAGQNEISPSIVAQLTNYTPELVLFDVIKKIETGSSREVFKLLFNDARQIEDSYLFAFIALMMREMRLLWKIKAKEQVFLPSSQIKPKTDIAVRLGFTNISKIISLLCFAEFAVKSGRKSPLNTFEELIKDILKIYKKDTHQLSTLYSQNIGN